VRRPDPIFRLTIEKEKNSNRKTVTVEHTMAAETPPLLQLGKEDPSWQRPHAFHINLPPHHFDDDGIPLITKYAYKKSRHILDLVHSLLLTEAMFDNENAGDISLEDEDDALLDDEHMVGDEEEELGSQTGDTLTDQDSLGAFVRKCVRLQSQLSSLESLKHSGLTRMELCEMILHLLKLLTATVTLEYNTTTLSSSVVVEGDTSASTTTTSSPRKPKVTLHYENVGYIHTTQDEVYDNAATSAVLEESLQP
jgi:hypothetical protein